MTTKIYNDLKALIAKNNDIYLDHLNRLAEADHTNRDEMAVKEFEKWQFIHDYATELCDYILNVDLTTISPKDFGILDMVPYMVYDKMTGKVKLIVQKTYSVFNKKGG